MALEVTAPGEILVDASGKFRQVGQPTQVDAVVGPPSKEDVERGTAIGQRVDLAAHVPLDTNWGDEAGTGYTIKVSDVGVPYDGTYGIGAIRRTRSFYRLLLTRAG